jgi:hypothetical protein
VEVHQAASPAEAMVIPLWTVVNQKKLTLFGIAPPLGSIAVQTQKQKCQQGEFLFLFLFCPCGFIVISTSRYIFFLACFDIFQIH